MSDQRKNVWFVALAALVASVIAGCELAFHFTTLGLVQ